MQTNVRQNMAINSKAPVVCRESIRISATQPVVWSLLTNINAWNSWQPDIRKAELRGNLQKGSTFRWLSGGARIRSIVHTADPGGSLGWTGRAAGIRAIHNWTMEEVQGEGGRETLLTVEESMEGPLARLLSGKLERDLERGMLTWLTSLKQEAEQAT